MMLVSGRADADKWGGSRKTAAVNAIMPFLRGAQVEIASGSHILDFGCGCSRILAGWEHYLPKDARLLGCDVNADLIAFCRDKIPFANKSVCGFYPPLEFNDGSIDFAYAASVWTHMMLPAVVQWAGEFAWIIKVGGTAFVSTTAPIT
jgi:ubiquinone/menaquinone biosynthesis C-methylase UbiE